MVPTEKARITPSWTWAERSFFTSFKQASHNRSKTTAPSGWRSRKWRMTREGKLFVVVASFVGFAAVNTGNNLVYLVFAFMLTLLLVSGVLSEINLSGIAISRKLPSRIYADTPFLVELNIRNSKRYCSSYCIRLQEFRHSSNAFVLQVSRSHHERVGYQLTLRHRGAHRLDGMWLHTQFPFGLVEKSKLIHGGSDLLVYPKPLHSPQAHSLLEAEQGEHGSMDKTHGDGFYGLREFAPGDQAKRIHWRRSASIGQLVVKDLRQTSSPCVRVILDPLEPSPNDAAWREDFELAIRKTAGIVVHSLAHGTSVELLIRGDKTYRIAPQHGAEQALRYLALLEPKSATRHSEER